MKATTIALVVIISLVFVSTAFSVPPGKTLTFPDGKIGKVVFDGKKHKDAGVKCKDCHNGTIFPSMKDAKAVVGPPVLTMKDLNAGKYCGACHNGTTEINGKVVFKTKGTCKKCHIKE